MTFQKPTRVYFIFNRREMLWGEVKSYFSFHKRYNEIKSFLMWHNLIHSFFHLFLLLFLLVISPVPFHPVWLVQSIIGQLVFSSVSVLFQTILSNARLYNSKLDEKGHKVVKSPTGIAGRNQLNSEFLLVFSPVPFRPVLTCPISHWTAGIFVCFRFIPNNSVQC